MFFYKTRKKCLDLAVRYSNTSCKFITTFGFVSGTVSNISIENNSIVYTLNNVTINPLNSPEKEVFYSLLEFSSSEIRAIGS